MDFPPRFLSRSRIGPVPPSDYQSPRQPRGDFKQSEYGRVILPSTVLRRLDCVLAATKAAVLSEHSAKVEAGLPFEPFVLKKAGVPFDNVSTLDEEGELAPLGEEKSSKITRIASL